MDAAYFRSRYCVEELAVALAAYRALRRRGAADDLLERAALPVVVALPPAGARPRELALLPPEVRGGNWPEATATAKLAEVVRGRAAAVSETIRERLDRLDELGEVRERWHETSSILPPLRLERARVYHEARLPASIGDAFVGRSRELWELHTALAPPPRGMAAPTVLVEGGGGTGKTCLALEYVRRCGPASFPGGLLWLNAAVPEDRLEAQMHGMLRILRPTVPGLAPFRESGRDAAEELGAALRDEAARGAVLYVVDDVPEPEGTAPPAGLERWCPAPEAVSLLMTSRARQPALVGVRRLEVGELPAEAAARLLHRGLDVRRALPEAGWREIARWVGELPLALQLLGSAIASGAVSPDELREAADAALHVEAVDRWSEAARAEAPAGTLKSLAEALELSCRKLPAPARRAARLVACLAPEPIPVQLLSAGAGGPLSAGDRAQLRSRSFLTGAPSAAGSLGRMHPVLAAYLRDTAPDLDADLRAASDALLRLLTEEACGSPAAWSLLNACRPHAEAVFLRWREAAPDAGQPPVRLGLAVGLLLREQGLLADAERWAETCLALARATLGDEHPETLRAMGSLAAALHDRGQTERARPLAEEVLAARRRVLGRRHPETLRAMASLAAILYDEDDLDRAASLERRLLRLCERSLGEQHLDTLRALDGLAATLHARGELGPALGLAARALRARAGLLGDDHPQTLSSAASLAALLHDQGDLARAADIQRRVLDARERLLGGEHPDTLRAMGSLAATLHDRGDLDGAGEIEERVLEARLRVLGDEHPDTLLAMESLARTLGARGEAEAAAELAGRANEVRWRRHGRPPHRPRPVWL